MCVFNDIVNYICFPSFFLLNHHLPSSVKLTYISKFHSNMFSLLDIYMNLDYFHMIFTFILVFFHIVMFSIYFYHTVNTLSTFSPSPQLSYSAWRNFLYGFWLTVIVYQMVVLVLTYTYQFDNFPHYWENYTYIPIQLQKDMGLEVGMGREGGNEDKKELSDKIDVD